ncbi:MAG: transglutaminase-like cysteine peptidase [Desulfobulbaceae bacterium]|nr:transglutaminase-like cysteine peptidase [Desulfobulbaceae bacterium]
MVGCQGEIRKKTATETDKSQRRLVAGPLRGRGATVARPGLAVALLLLLLGGAGCTAKRTAPLLPERPVAVQDSAELRIARWHALVRDKQGVPEPEKLESVNHFFNQLEFVDDLVLWGREDYWATPFEMLRKNGGDCEDFAIGKYLTLRQLHVPDDRLRLTYVKSLTINKPHMVVSYYPQPDVVPLLLDKLVAAILPASQRTDLIPVYSFNGEGLWLAKRRGQGERAGDAGRISVWQDLLRRLRSEAVAGTWPEIEEEKRPGL